MGDAEKGGTVMGYYIEVPENHHKAEQLVRLEHAEQLPGPPSSLKHIPEDKMLICVVSNLLFDAAGICYDDRELREFASPDGRPRSWLLMDKARVLELCPHVKDVL